MLNTMSAHSTFSFPALSPIEISDDELALLQSPEVIQPLNVEGLSTHGFTLTPHTSDQVAKLLYLASDKKTPLALSQDAALSFPSPIWLKLDHLNTIRNHRVADKMVTVETGITIGELQEALGQHAQHFPLHYPPDTLLLDVIASDLPALETGIKGHPRDYVLATEIATPDGHVTKYGGEVVKNVTGYDLNKLYVGAENTLGVVTAVTLKLESVPDAQRTWCIPWSPIEHPLEPVFAIQQRFPEITQLEAFECTPADFSEWRLHIHACGNPTVLDAIEQAIQTLPVSADPYRLPDSETAHRTPETLQHYLNQSQVIVFSVPKTDLTKTIKTIRNTLPHPKSYTLQVRLAAGLIILSRAPQMSSQSQPLQRLSTLDLETSLSHLLKEIQHNTPRHKALNGFIKLQHFSKDFHALVAQFNLPACPITRQLMQQIKTQYDPNGILYSPNLCFS